MSSPDASSDGRGDGRAGTTRERGQLATEAVVEHLEHLVFSGGLEYGDTLPSESQLSVDVGVSRLTVREAVRSLVARGLIETGHGRRPVIAHPNAAPLRDFFDAAVRRDARGLLELLEVRLAVEVHTAQLAARHATRADLAAIRGALTAMREAVDDEEAFNEADIRFHAAVASASGNSMLGFLVEGMEGPLHTSVRASLRGYRSRAPDLAELVERHGTVLERIEARDPQGAADRMREHLIGTRTELRTAFSLVAAGATGRDGTT